MAATTARTPRVWCWRILVIGELFALWSENSAAFTCLHPCTRLQLHSLYHCPRTVAHVLVDVFRLHANANPFGRSDGWDCTVYGVCSDVHVRQCSSYRVMVMGASLVGFGAVATATTGCSPINYRVKIINNIYSFTVRCAADWQWDGGALWKW